MKVDIGVRLSPRWICHQSQMCSNTIQFINPAGRPLIGALLTYSLSSWEKYKRKVDQVERLSKKTLKLLLSLYFPLIAMINVQGLQQLDGCGGEQVESHRRDCSDASQCKVFSTSQFILVHLSSSQYMRDCSNASQCKVFQLSPHLIHISDLLSDSLLLDDIEDSSILRRGLPVAHKIFGEVMISPLSTYLLASMTTRPARSTAPTM